ncbi:MAG: tetratricopeptide repeat protein [Phycisphaerales bacterium]|nr:tetratricopeptide repeat protein [Phycisphaerales bacterium]
MPCPEIEQLEQYLSGELELPQRSSVDLHLTSCESCRALLEELGENAQTLAAVRSACVAVGGAAGDDAPIPNIPGYDIIRSINAGGQGIIYEARQESTKRTVAVKLLLHGRYADKLARRRFEREIDLAASLNHPSIVAVFDSGTTEDGRMYLVMRYVEGAALDVVEAARELEVEATLQLFRKIAAAVNYAHQRGVIHRDLKPSNVLIDAEGEPHLLDFGLAKTLDLSEAQQSVHTQAGDFVGTLAYAAPEQVGGDPNAVDVRSDVYALGVMLYEMLTAEHPYPIDGHLASIVRSITEQEAMRPSTKRREVDDELDTIVLKALAKAKDRRYQSVADLLRDLERYAAGQPIEAKGDSTLYLLRKTLSRHRGPVAAVAVIFLALTAATVVSVGFWRAAEADSARAQAAFEQSDLQAKKAQAINDFLLDILASANPRRLGRDVTVREAIDQAAATIDASFTDQPLVEADVRNTLAVTYRALGLYEAAEPQVVRALEIRRSLLSEAHIDTLVSMATLGLLFSDAGRFDEAEELTTGVYELHVQHSGEDSPYTLAALNNLGLLRYRQGQHLEAEAIWERVLAGQRAVLGEDHSNTLRTMSNLGWVYCNRGKFDQAVEMSSKSLEIRRRVSGPEHPETLQALSSAAYLATFMGRYAQAANHMEEAYQVQRRVMGESHADTLNTMDGLGWAYLMQGRYEDAQALQLKTIALAKQALGEHHPMTLRMMNNLAVNYDRQERLDMAEPLYRETLDLRREHLGDEHPDTLASLSNLAVVYYQQGRLDETERLWDEVLELRKRTLGNDHPETFVAMHNLAVLYARQGRFDEADKMYAQVLDLRRRVLGPDHPKTLGTMHNIAALRRDQGRLDEAISLGEQVYKRRQALLGHTHPDTLWTLYDLMEVLVRRNAFEQAEQMLISALTAVETEFGEEHQRSEAVRERLTLLREMRAAAAAESSSADDE